MGWPQKPYLAGHVESLHENGIDRNRYLELRRIAIENLAGVL